MLDTWWGMGESGDGVSSERVNESKDEETGKQEHFDLWSVSVICRIVLGTQTFLPNLLG